MLKPRYRRSGRIPAALWLTSAMVYALAIAFADSVTKSANLAYFGLNLITWTGAATFVIMKASGDGLNFGNSMALVLFWCYLYFELPSIIWIMGGRIIYEVHIYPGVWEKLQLLYSLLMVSILFGYYRVRRSNVQKVYSDSMIIPKMWVAILLCIAPLIFLIVSNIIEFDSIFSKSNYGESWYAMQDDIKASRATGGLGYVWTQVMSKIWFYPVLLQSWGVGYYMIHRMRANRGFISIYGLPISIVLAQLLLKSGGRSGVIIIIIIAIVIVSKAERPIQFRNVALGLMAGLLFFDLYGVLREADASEFLDYMGYVWSNYFNGDILKLGEMTVMLSKDSYGVSIIDSTGFEPLNILSNIFSVVPSQVNPLKGVILPTSDWLSREMLDFKHFSAGGGVAGSMVLDGYRSFGVIGVLFSGLMAGSVIGYVENKLDVRGNKKATSKFDNIIRISLFSGFVGWMFNIVRSDIGALLGNAFYNVAIPLIIYNKFKSKV